MAKRSEKKKAKKETKGAAPESACDLEVSPQAPAETGGIAFLDSLRRSRYLQLLLLLILLGAFLRFLQLGSASLWLDEATTLNDARRSFLEIWDFVSMGEFTPPLFFWLEKGMLAFGESETVLRLVPAVFGILTIPVFYAIGTELLDRRAGILAAALLTFSPFAIFYSQEARAYGAMLFFFSVAFVFFLRTQRTGAWKDALLFGIFSSISLWAHLYAFVPVAALIISGFVIRGKEILRDVRAALPMAVSTIAFALLSLPLLISALQLFALRTGGGPSFGVQGLETISLTFVQVSGFSRILAILFVVLFIIGIASLYRVSRGKALVLAFVLLFSLVLGVLLSYRMPMVPRYLIYLLAVLLPGIALVVRPACALFPDKRLVYFAIALIFLVNLPGLYGYYSTPQKEDWRGFARELGSAAAPGDLVVVLPGYVTQPLDYYYRNETSGTTEYQLYTVDEIQRAIAANPGRPVWFIVTMDIRSADPGGQVLTWLEGNSRLVLRDASGGIFLLRYTG